ncbi:MAG: type II toxin-antitoxin system RatA family toxin [Pararhodobacter sp.]|nr:type II toxin-antitoxin system RatA family toxin [Pararhodobacter sp.]
MRPAETVGTGDPARCGGAAPPPPAAGGGGRGEWGGAPYSHGGRGVGAEVLEADLVISFKVFRERFGSRVVLIPDARRIETAYLDGPFKYLQSFWQIDPEGAGCRVQFEVDFEFRNAILQKAIGLFFDEAMRRVVGAFDRRARQLYG